MERTGDVGAAPQVRCGADAVSAGGFRRGRAWESAAEQDVQDRCFKISQICLMVKVKITNCLY